MAILLALVKHMHAKRRVTSAVQPCQQDLLFDVLSTLQSQSKRVEEGTLSFTVLYDRACHNILVPLPQGPE